VPVDETDDDARNVQLLRSLVTSRPAAGSGHTRR